MVTFFHAAHHEVNRAAAAADPLTSSSFSFYFCYATAVACFCVHAAGTHSCLLELKITCLYLCVWMCERERVGVRLSVGAWN